MAIIAAILCFPLSARLLPEARAFEGLGEREAALATVRRLLRLWKRADPGLRLLHEARALERRLAATTR